MFVPVFAVSKWIWLLGHAVHHSSVNKSKVRTKTLYRLYMVYLQQSKWRIRYLNLAIGDLNYCFVYCLSNVLPWSRQFHKFECRKEIEIAKFEQLYRRKNWYTVSPKNSDPNHIITYYKRWVTTSWTHSTLFFNQLHAELILSIRPNSCNRHGRNRAAPPRISHPHILDGQQIFSGTYKITQPAYFVRPTQLLPHPGHE